jgi:hypothetical protein
MSLALGVAFVAMPSGAGDGVLLAGYGNSGLTISTTSLPNAVAGQRYSATIFASGGTPPYTWSIGATGSGSAHTRPTGLSFAPATNSLSGEISGTPPYAGTSAFTVTVTDADGTTASQLESLAVDRPSQPFAWTLCLGPQCATPLTEDSGQSGTDPKGGLVLHPHVAFVLVGKWWCTLYGVDQPVQCPSKYAEPQKCKGCLAEASEILGDVTSMFATDYSDAYPEGYDYGLSRYFEVTQCGFPGCEATYVGTGVAQRLDSANGNLAFLGPITPSQASCSGSCPHLTRTLNAATGGFGIKSQSEVDETVFVLLHEPKELDCVSGSKFTEDYNSRTAGGRPGVYGSFVFADIYLQDARHHCSGYLNEHGATSTVLSPGQFATYAVSHEFDEAVTDPASMHYGWWVKEGMQIADPCHGRTAAGTTAYADPFFNFTRDPQGTVVSAYVNPETDACEPDVSTAIPPE